MNSPPHIAMVFQLSLDQPDLDQALQLGRLGVTAGVQVLEAGTGLILSEGAKRVLPRLKSMFPEQTLVADIKCTDGAVFEVGQMFDLGAAAATVMASASDATIRSAARAAESRPGSSVMVDTMGAGGHDGRNVQAHVDAARRARDLGAHYVVVHLGFDERGANPAMVEENLLLRWAEAVAAADLGVRVQVVGGLTLEQAARLPSFGIRDLVISMNLGSRPVGEMRYDHITGFTVDLSNQADCDEVRDQIRRFIQSVSVGV